MSSRSYRSRPVHGFSDDSATRRLLRSRPPEAALRWAGSVLGGTVVSASAIRGGPSSAVHLLEVGIRDGVNAKVVLRRYVCPELNAEEPGIAAREAGTLEHLESISVPTPRLLGVDPDGSQAGVPAVLMSRLGGRIDWWPADIGRWAERLADLLPAIHGASLPEHGAVPMFVPYAQLSYSPPEWARQLDVWERAFEVFHGPAPAGEQVFIQRDFHPGNVLWSRGLVSGVVDWQAACVGPPSIDVGHCRVNLFPYGLHVADTFSAVWSQLTGRTYDPWAEVVSVVGMLDGLRAVPPPYPLDAEDALARAIAELGGGA
jgi:aminoglycoside phosphotransferase (APT) family kinase protein